MVDTASPSAFRRTLPLFDNEDRDVIQRLLHHAVADFDYDHPDRKVARDIYHGIREGEAVRLYVGRDVDGISLSLSPSRVESAPATVIERFVSEMSTRDGEWRRVADDLRQWGDGTDLEDPALEVGFEYLH